MTLFLVAAGSFLSQTKAGEVTHAFNPSRCEGVCDLQASLLYILSYIETLSPKTKINSTMLLS